MDNPRTMEACPAPHKALHGVVEVTTAKLPHAANAPGQVSEVAGCTRALPLGPACRHRSSATTKLLVLTHTTGRVLVGAAQSRGVEHCDQAPGTHACSNQYPLRATARSHSWAADRHAALHTTTASKLTEHCQHAPRQSKVLGHSFAVHQEQHQLRRRRCPASTLLPWSGSCRPRHEIECPEHPGQRG